MNAAPAFKTASMLAKQNGAPFGILISTTPGSQSASADVKCKLRAKLHKYNFIIIFALYNMQYSWALYIRKYVIIFRELLETAKASVPITQLLESKDRNKSEDDLCWNKSY